MPDDPKPAPRRFVVNAEIQDYHGGGDGAYHLHGTWTAEEFAERVRETLQQSVASMLLGGREMTERGHVIKLEIRDYDEFADPDPDEDDK